MNRKRLFWLTLVLSLSSPLAVGANSGSWSKTAAGGVMSVGGQIIAGSPLVAPSLVPDSARVKSISWRISLLAPSPAGLKIKLCNALTCLSLPGLSGYQRITPDIAAAEPFRFIYTVDKRGQLLPALNVVSNQLTVNY